MCIRVNVPVERATSSAQHHKSVAPEVFILRPDRERGVIYARQPDEILIFLFFSPQYFVRNFRRVFLFREKGTWLITTMMYTRQ